MTRLDRGGRSRGQTTVEFALVLPLLLGLVLLVLHVGLVVRDQILVVNASREGARTAAVDRSPAAIRSSAVNAGALDPARVGVAHSVSGDHVTVTVTYRSQPTVPIIGPLLGDLTLTESTTMYVEGG